MLSKAKSFFNCSSKFSVNRYLFTHIGWGEMSKTSNVVVREE